MKNIYVYPGQEGYYKFLQLCNRMVYTVRGEGESEAEKKDMESLSL